MKRLKRKAFTIVELVIVIAIIAILAAVLIPTFSNLIKKANVSTDTQLVRNLNTALTADAVINGKHETMHDALEAVKESGYDVAKIMDTKATDNTILWDSENDIFCYLEDGVVKYIPNSITDTALLTDDYRLWKIYSFSEDEKQIVQNTIEKYSAYLYGNWTGDVTVLGKGIDTGNTELDNITYNKTTEARNVIIRTNGCNLTVNADTDDVKHYGLVKSLTITAVKPNHCYHEYGFVGEFVSFGTGKFIAEGSAFFHQIKEDVENILTDKSYDLDNGEKYEQHYFVNGICVIDNCNVEECNHTYNEGTIKQAATCTETGILEKTCTKCEKKIEETLVALGHNFSETYLNDENNHWHKCLRCDVITAVETHNLGYSNNDGDTHDVSCLVCGYNRTDVIHNFVDGTCACGKVENTIKNGIVDGYYYQNDLLYTGIINDEENSYEFKDGMLVIDYENKQYIKADGSSVVEFRTYNYTISSSEFLTNKIIIKANNSSYENKVLFNITDNSGKNYVVESVTSKSPFNGLLKKDNWTQEEIFANLISTDAQSLIKNGYILDNSNLLTTYETEADNPDKYDVFIPKLCVDSTLVQSFLSLNSCANIGEYYSKYQNNELVICLTDYMKLIYCKGYTFTRENDVIKYVKSFGSNYQSAYMGSFYVTIEADSESGLPIISFVSKNNGVYFSAPTTLKNGKIVFCDYVIEGVFNENVQYGNDLGLPLTDKYYVSKTGDYTVSMNKNSVTGTEYCRFEIDNDNKIIKTYMNSQITDVNGTPFTIPSSGNVTLLNEKISLTGEFDVSNCSIPFSSFSKLSGTSNSNYILFETCLIESIIKAIYKDSIEVYCNYDDYAYDVDTIIPGSVFTKIDNTLSATFEMGLADAAFSIAVNNYFNGIDYAGPTYEIVLTIQE